MCLMVQDQSIATCNSVGILVIRLVTMLEIIGVGRLEIVFGSNLLRQSIMVWLVFSYATSMFIQCSYVWFQTGASVTFITTLFTKLLTRTCLNSKVCKYCLDCDILKAPPPPYPLPISYYHYPSLDRRTGIRLYMKSTSNWLHVHQLTQTNLLS